MTEQTEWRHGDVPVASVPPEPSWPLVYIAAPYSGDQTDNIRHAISLADLVLRFEATPVVPHLSHLWDLIWPRDYEWWLAYDLALLARCDAVLHIPDDSPGAAREEAWAVEHSIPVAHSFAELEKILDALTRPDQ